MSLFPCIAKLLRSYLYFLASMLLPSFSFKSISIKPLPPLLCWNYSFKDTNDLLFAKSNCQFFLDNSFLLEILFFTFIPGHHPFFTFLLPWWLFPLANLLILFSTSQLRVPQDSSYFLAISSSLMALNITDMPVTPKCISPAWISSLNSSLIYTFPLNIFPWMYDWHIKLNISKIKQLFLLSNCSSMYSSLLGRLGSLGIFL